MIFFIPCKNIVDLDIGICNHLKAKLLKSKLVVFPLYLEPSGITLIEKVPKTNKVTKFFIIQARVYLFNKEDELFLTKFVVGRNKFLFSLHFVRES